MPAGTLPQAHGPRARDRGAWPPAHGPRAIDRGRGVCDPGHRLESVNKQSRPGRAAHALPGRGPRPARVKAHGPRPGAGSRAQAAQLRELRPTARRYQGAQLTATGPRATIRPGPAQGPRATAPVPGCDIPGRPPARRGARGAGPRLARVSSLRYADGPVPAGVNKQTRPGRQGFGHKKTRPGPGSRLQLQRLGGELGPLGLPCIGAGR